MLIPLLLNLAGSVTGTANLAGSSTSTGTGTLTATGAANTALTGNSSLTGTGAVTATGAGAASLTGSGATVSTGGISATGAASTALTGTSSSSATGNIISTGAAWAVLLGSANSSATGALSGEGGFVISATRAGLIHQLALLHGLDAANPLTVSASARSAGALTQSVSGSTTVTVTTSAAPVFSGSLDAWIDGLAALHGLTAPLVVTATSRAAGAVTQSIAAVNGLTTVTRQ